MSRSALVTLLGLFSGVTTICLAGTNAGPPGVVIDHSPASSRAYIGSPSLAVWTNGAYIVSHDFFGPGTANNRTVVFKSTDRGTNWQKLTEMEGQWWSTLFCHADALYVLGTTTEYGNLVIRRSIDGGRTWTVPNSATNGLLRADGQYHCAPTPLIEHAGRLWRGTERRDPPSAWGKNFCAGMISVATNADLLDASAWTLSNLLHGKSEWLGGTFGGWLEGNAVVSRDGRLIDVLRVDTTGYPEKAARVEISGDGKTASFDPQTGFVDFPGGAKKFTIRYDSTSACYWTLATIVPADQQTRAKPSSVRNTLALMSSKDLKAWTVRAILIQHPDQARHGFQYVDWLFEGEDIIAVCRTAFDDDADGAHRAHDANFLTFHRIRNFRASGDAMKSDKKRVSTDEPAISGSLSKLTDSVPSANGIKSCDNLRRDGDLLCLE